MIADREATFEPEKQTPEPLFLTSLPVSLSVGSSRLRCFTILCDLVETDAI